MSLKIFKKIRLKNLSSAIIFCLIVTYIVLIAGSAVFLTRRTGTETGQLIPGQPAQAGNISRSLDLRTAAGNIYPSSALTVVRDIGSPGGLPEKIISFKVPVDGLTEYGLMLLPGQPAPKNGYPTIVYCHGYENPRMYSTTEQGLDDMEFYAQHGFAVIKPDYRGQGLSVGHGQATSAYYSIDYNTDVMSLISALKKTTYIDKSNLNLWGHSMGAYIALRAAVLSPEIKNLIILSGPVDSLSKMYLSYIPPSDVNNLNALKVRNDTISKYGTPDESSPFWKFASPINLISRIKAHIQIHVGELDQTVPPEFSADLDSALTKAHIKHDYYTYPDGQHSLEPQRFLIWPRSLQILQPPQPAQSSA